MSYLTPLLLISLLGLIALFFYGARSRKKRTRTNWVSHIAKKAEKTAELYHPSPPKAEPPPTPKTEPFVPTEKQLEEARYQVLKELQEIVESQRNALKSKPQ